MIQEIHTHAWELYSTHDEMERIFFLAEMMLETIRVGYIKPTYNVHLHTGQNSNPVNTKNFNKNFGVFFVKIVMRDSWR